MRPRQSAADGAGALEDGQEIAVGQAEAADVRAGEAQVLRGGRP